MSVVLVSAQVGRGRIRHVFAPDLLGACLACGIWFDGDSMMILGTSMDVSALVENNRHHMCSPEEVLGVLEVMAS